MRCTSVAGNSARLMGCLPVAQQRRASSLKIPEGENTVNRNARLLIPLYSGDERPTPLERACGHVRWHRGDPRRDADDPRWLPKLGHYPLDELVERTSAQSGKEDV